MIKTRFTMIFTLSLLLIFVVGAFTIHAADERMAVIFPGSIQDADYNATGYITMQEIKEELDIDVAFSEKVAVPDAARALSEYAESGFGIIWAHGAQFNQAVLEVAPDYPEATFIIEGDAKLKDDYSNVILLERNYYLGFYVLGALAAKTTETNQIGYVGGLQLPFTYAEINAIDQALNEYNPDAEFHYIYVGDFNDPLKTRQAAESLISKGVDFIISGVNLGNYGLFKAVQNAERQVYVTTTYTDKNHLAPEHHVTSDLFRYKRPVFQAIEYIRNGTTSAFIPMEFGADAGRYLKFPLDNVSEEINQEIKAIAEKVASGEIKVEKKLDGLNLEN